MSSAAATAGGPLPVVMDAGPAVHQGAGLSRYAERLAAHLLAEQAGRVALNLFYNAHSGHTPPPSLAAAPARTLRLGQYPWRLGALASQLLRAPLFARPLCRGAALYHAAEHLLPCLPCPTVLTVHDLIFERYPQHHTRLNRLFLQTAMPRFVAAAGAVIAVSKSTRRDLVDLYGAPAEKISVIYEGIDPVFTPAPSDEVARVAALYSPDRPYLLMVGTLEPRKNHATAMAALARLKAAGLPHRLLVVGGQGWLFAPIQAQVERLGLAGDVHFAGYAPTADLPALYSGAACVLLPSLYEGFGFPALEAMACAAPVVCSDAGSLPEVAGDAALLVPPTDDAALAAAVRRILDDSALAAEMRRRGPAHTARFTWSACAAQTADLYHEVAARNGWRSGRIMLK